MTDERRVTSNKFYPFFLYYEEWQPYRSANAAKLEKKSRPVRYGARRDAYIFVYYRRKLSAPYEQRLADIGISDCPIAYRQIPKPGTNGGKCNIDFAKDAFDEVDRLGDCVALALGIKGYFENLSHLRIKAIWCDLLGIDELPADHYAVFKNITKYRSLINGRSTSGWTTLDRSNGASTPLKASRSHIGKCPKSYAVRRIFVPRFAAATQPNPP